jgi:hypothetical protein
LRVIGRWGQRKYLVYVAASLELLQDDDRAFVVVVAEKQLVRACLYARPRAESATRFVAPARILPPDLRLRASCAGLCYFVLEGAPDEAGHTLVRVAPLAERLDVHAHAVYARLGPEELAQALPVTRELRSLPTCDLRWQVEGHAYQVTGSSFPSCTELPAECARAEQEPVSATAPEPTATIEIEVSFDAVLSAASGPQGSSQSSCMHDRPDRQTFALLLVRAALRVVTRDRESQRRGAHGPALAEQELWLRSMLVWRERWSHSPGQYVEVVGVLEEARCATVRIGILPSLLCAPTAAEEMAA